MANVYQTELRRTHRGVLLLVYALAALPYEGANYKGVQVALGMTSRRAVRSLVRRAQGLGFVQVAHGTANERSVIRLTDVSVSLLRHAFHKPLLRESVWTLPKSSTP